MLLIFKSYKVMQSLVLLREAKLAMQHLLRKQILLRLGVLDYTQIYGPSMRMTYIQYLWYIFRFITVSNIKQKFNQFNAFLSTICRL